MSSIIKLAPSILSADFTNLAQAIQEVEEAHADLLHIDVMDGNFVPNITIGPVVVKAINKCTNLPLDVHLMVAEPDKFIKPFIDAGADWITVHIETTKHLHKTLHLIRDNGAKVGIALNPYTSLSLVEPTLLQDLDLLLIMTVNPGFSGQRFIPEVLPKLQRARELLDTNHLSNKIELEVDGGVSIETVSSVVKHGGTILVAGNAVFCGPLPTIKANIEALRTAINRALH